MPEDTRSPGADLTSVDAIPDVERNPRMTTSVKVASVPLLNRGGAVVTTLLITTSSAGRENRTPAV